MIVQKRGRGLRGGYIIAKGTLDDREREITIGGSASATRSTEGNGKKKKKGLTQRAVATSR